MFLACFYYNDVAAWSRIGLDDHRGRAGLSEVGSVLGYQIKVKARLLRLTKTAKRQAAAINEAKGIISIGHDNISANVSCLEFSLVRADHIGGGIIGSHDSHHIVIALVYQKAQVCIGIAIIHGIIIAHVNVQRNP
jgi:hypothetical protein